MWTRRCNYLTEDQQISDYLDSMGQFHDYLIGSFSYKSNSNLLQLTIEEDYLADDVSNSKSLVWDLECQGVENFLMDDMEGTSAWWLSEVLFDGQTFQIQLVNGFISFDVESCKLGIPYHHNLNIDGRKLQLQFAYLLQEFIAGVNVDELVFAFETDSQDLVRCIGYSENDDKPYWADDACTEGRIQFKTAEELFTAPIYSGKSLKERWYEVTILSVKDLSLEDWLTNAQHSVEVSVEESDDESCLFINGIALDGFVVEESHCEQCGANKCYLEDYDTYFCPYCNLWLSDDFWYDGDYFKKRPLEPELLWKPAKLLRFAHVQYGIEGKLYTYYCPDKSIVEGDKVLVPVGKNNMEKEARVVAIFLNPANHPPYPLHKIKRILKKLPAVADKVIETVSHLLNEGRFCDVSDTMETVDASQVYDILKTPLGNFWLELNGIPVPMKIIGNDSQFESYHVDGALHIKPSCMFINSFESLELCSDADIDGARWIDVLSDEYVWGNAWEIKGFHLGITGNESPEFEDELTTRHLSRVPYYAGWHTDWQESYGFNLAWKPYVSDEDLSVDFYTT